MREIKFRGKEINTDEWVFGFYTQGSFIDPNTGKETVRHIIHADFLHDVEPETIGQYTGLKDRNGKEIYEGDIIYSEFSDRSNCHCLVGWNEEKVCFGLMDEFAFRSKQEGYDFPKFDSLVLWNFRNYGTKFEVVGDIHDNPELIKLR